MKDLQAILKKYEDPQYLDKAINTIADDIVSGKIVLGDNGNNRMVIEPDDEWKMYDYLRGHSLAQTARYFCRSKEAVRKFAIKYNLR